VQQTGDDLTWLAAFPGLVSLDETAKELLQRHARIVEAPFGTIVYREADPCNACVTRLAQGA
jgi:CRP/FNR family transcriptional regulator, anaerobic regulatory protein